MDIGRRGKMRLGGRGWDRNGRMESIPSQLLPPVYLEEGLDSNIHSIRKRSIEQQWGPLRISIHYDESFYM